MTMLEKMAREICDEDSFDPDWMAYIDGAAKPLWNKYVPHARAALLAIREPTGAMCNAAYAVKGFGNRWTAMIDAILAEKPEC